MTLELNLYFPDSGHVTVRLDEDGEHDESETLPFRGPLAEQDQKGFAMVFGGLRGAVHR